MYNSHLIELLESAVGLSKQILWGVAFHNMTCMQDHNTIVIDNGIQSMCDTHDRTVLELFSNNTLHDGICMNVDTRILD